MYPPEFSNPANHIQRRHPQHPFAVRVNAVLEGFREQCNRTGAHASAIKFLSLQATALIEDVLEAHAHAASGDARLQQLAAELFSCMQRACQHTTQRLKLEIVNVPSPSPLKNPKKRLWRDDDPTPTEQMCTMAATVANALAKFGPQVLPGGKAQASRELWALVDPLIAAGVVPSQGLQSALLGTALVLEDAVGVAALASALPLLGFVDTEHTSTRTRKLLMDILERRAMNGGWGQEEGGGAGDAAAAAADLVAVAGRLSGGGRGMGDTGGAGGDLDSAFETTCHFLLNPSPLALYKNAAAGRLPAGSGPVEAAVRLAAVLQKRARLVQRLCLLHPQAAAAQNMLHNAWKAELQLAALKFSHGSSARMEAPLEQGAAGGREGAGGQASSSEEKAASDGALEILLNGVVRRGETTGWMEACFEAYRNLFLSLDDLQQQRLNSGQSPQDSAAQEELLGLQGGPPGLHAADGIALPAAAVTQMGEAILTYLLLPRLKAATAAGQWARAREISSQCMVLAGLVWETRGGGANPHPPLSFAMGKSLLTAMLAAGNPGAVTDLLRIFEDGGEGGGGQEGRSSSSSSSSSSSGGGPQQALVVDALDTWCRKIVEGDEGASQDVGKYAGIAGSTAASRRKDQATVLSSLLLALPGLASTSVQVPRESLGRIMVLGVEHWAGTLRVACPQCFKDAAGGAGAAAAGAAAGAAAVATGPGGGAPAAAGERGGATGSDSGSSAQVQRPPLTRAMRAAMETKWSEVTRELALDALPPPSAASAGASHRISPRPARRVRDAAAAAAAAAAAGAAAASPHPAAPPSTSSQVWVPLADISMPSSAAGSPRSSVWGCSTLWKRLSPGGGGEEGEQPPQGGSPLESSPLIPLALPPSRQIELLSLARMLDEVPKEALTEALAITCTAGCGREAWALWREMRHRGLEKELLERVRYEGSSSSSSSSGSGSGSGPGGASTVPSRDRSLLFQVLRVFAAGGQMLPAWDVYVALVKGMRGGGGAAVGLVGALPNQEELVRWAREEGAAHDARLREVEAAQATSSLGLLLSGGGADTEAILKGVTSALGVLPTPISVDEGSGEATR